MNIFESLFLGAIQGLTEFLPVSSSGHLVAFQHFLGVEEGQLTFDIVVHLGTLLTVFTVYWRPIYQLIKSIFDGAKKRECNSGVQLLIYVVIASIPTGLMGVFLKDYWSSVFAKMHWVGIFLFLTGTLLYLVRRPAEENTSDFTHPKIETLNWKKALIVGVAQGCAILPGVSRAGTTMATGIFLGVERQTAAFFSFLLMIPAVAGASLLELGQANWAEIDLAPMLAGFISAYICGLAALIFVLRTVKRGRLEIFSPYLWLFGGGLALYALLQ